MLGWLKLWVRQDLREATEYWDLLHYELKIKGQCVNLRLKQTMQEPFLPPGSLNFCGSLMSSMYLDATVQCKESVTKCWKMAGICLSRRYWLRHRRSRFPRERNEAANRSQTSSNEARFTKISRCLIIHMTKKYSVVLNKIYIVQHLLLRTF